MKKLTLFMIGFVIGLIIAHSMLGRPLADSITSAFEKHIKDVENKIREVENGNM